MVMARDIDISLLRSFLAVAESGGMTSAAHSLSLTQGAVSQQIKRLESLFGAQLFEREHKMLRLTAAGERLMARAHRMVALNDDTWHLMTKPAFTGEIKLGVPLDIVRPLLPPIMRRFSREHPKIQLTLISDMTDSLLEGLKNGEIDLTLATEGEKRKKDQLLLSDRLVWVGAKNGEACYRDPLPVSLGSEHCAFRAPSFEALTNVGIDWLEVCGVGNLESILGTVEADMAVAPYMTRMVPEQLVAIESSVGLPLLPIYHINLHMPPSGGTQIAKELAEYIKRGFAAFQGR